MKIRDVKTSGLQVELPKAFEGGTYRITQRATIITEITTDEGVVGRMYSGDTRGEGQGVVRAIIEEEMKPLVVGEDIFAPERIWAKLFKLAAAEPKRHVALMEALSAIDIAIWDAIGKAAGRPVYQLWGGYRDVVPIIGIGGYYQEGKTLGGLAEEIDGMREQGMAGLKLKVGRFAVQDDLERLATVRDTAGDDFLIACDANRAWRLEDAIEFARGAEQFNVLWLEEPLQWNNEIAGMRRLREVTSIPVNAGQSVHSAAQVRDLVAGKAIDFCNLDASYAGGPTEWRKAAAYAELHGVKMAHHEEPQVAVHLLASAPNSTYVECFPSVERDPLWDVLIANRPEIHDGQIDVPQGPGFGFEFDEDVIARHSV